MAAGKSTLSRELAERENTVLIVQDEFLERLFPGEIVGIPGFLKYSSRLKFEPPSIEEKFNIIRHERS